LAGANAEQQQQQQQQQQALCFAESSNGARPATKTSNVLIGLALWVCS
jgi:hypothetical protein